MENKHSDAELTSAMLKALQERYVRPEWVFMTEVPDGTGAQASRRADAAAYNLFPSKGNVMHVFELKASKSDLKKELSDGTKSNAVGQFANYFFLVCPDGIIDNTMLLPKTWGILMFKNGKLRQIRRPEELKPKPMTRNFVAALLQSMLRANDSELSDIENNIDKIAYEKTQRQLEHYVHLHQEESQRTIERLKKQLDIVSKWRDAMSACYREDFFNISRGVDYKWINTKSIDDLISDDNLVKDLADFIALRQELKKNAQSMQSNVEQFKNLIDGVYEIFLRPAAYLADKSQK